MNTRQAVSQTPFTVALVVTATLALALPLANVAAQASAGRVGDTTFSVAANAVIDINIRTGNIVVRGSDRSVAELRANSKDYQLRSNGVSVTLGVSSGSGSSAGSRSRRASSRSGSPDVELTVPRNVRLVIRGTSGDVHVSDVNGDVEVHVLSGDIVTRSLGGRAILDAVSGDVRVTDGVGDLRISTTGGDIVARQIRGSVEIGTTSGDIDLTAASFSRVQIATVSGDVTLEGALSSDASLQFTTHSGDVVLKLPESTAGLLEMTTFSGSVRGGPFTLLPNGSRSTSGRPSDGNVRRYELGGGGGGRISVSTFSGDVVVRRGAQQEIDQ